MDGERILGIVVMIFCSLVCGGIFVGMGFWAMKRKDPMHFYSGTSVDPKNVSDVSAYNQANARMWFIYAVPYLLSGIVSFFHLGVAAAIMSIGCFPGIPWLLFKYRRICKEYMIR